MQDEYLSTPNFPSFSASTTSNTIKRNENATNGKSLHGSGTGNTIKSSIPSKSAPIPSTPPPIVVYSLDVKKLNELASYANISYSIKNSSNVNKRTIRCQDLNSHKIMLTLLKNLKSQHYSFTHAVERGSTFLIKGIPLHYSETEVLVFVNIIGFSSIIQSVTSLPLRNHNHLNYFIIKLKPNVDHIFIKS